MKTCSPQVTIRDQSVVLNKVAKIRWGGIVLVMCILMFVLPSKASLDLNGTVHFFTVSENSAILWQADDDFFPLISRPQSYAAVGSLNVPIDVSSIDPSPPVVENVSDFIVFASPAGVTSLGTTPINRFHFDLSTLTYNGHYPGHGNSFSYTGLGILYDTAGVYDDMFATFNWIGYPFGFDWPSPFDNSSFYSSFFTLTTTGVAGSPSIPEPASIWTGIVASLILVCGIARHFCKRVRTHY